MLDRLSNFPAATWGLVLLPPRAKSASFSIDQIVEQMMPKS